MLLADGLKVPKSGRKMPAVKRLHQVSDSNTKPEYIRGHSLQVVSLLVCAASSFLAVPLVARIHEGVKFTPRDRRTLPEKLTTLIESLASRLREASASYFPAVVLTRRPPERHPSTLVTCRGRPATR